ncbi:MAG: hypothetical protein ACJA0U_002543 [Salibacteraceae bacterium]|jgi:hypothetical protein
MEKLVKCVLRKKILNSGLIAAFIVFAGIQSVEAQSINNNPNTFEKPASDLSKKKLNLVDLKAFEDRAVQKVDELFQYLEVMADHAHNDAVRDRAMEVAEKQFSSSAKIYSGSKGQAILEYLKKCRKGTTYKSVESLSVSKPFVFKPDGQYEGKVLVRYKKQDSKTDVKSSKVNEEEINVFLIRQEKMFGDSKQFVWGLSLDRIDG